MAGKLNLNRRALSLRRMESRTIAQGPRGLSGSFSSAPSGSLRMRYMIAMVFLLCMLLVLIRYAPECKPGEGGIRLGNVLMAGCP